MPGDAAVFAVTHEGRSVRVTFPPRRKSLGGDGTFTSAGGRPWPTTCCAHWGGVSHLRSKPRGRDASTARTKQEKAT